MIYIINGAAGAGKDEFCKKVAQITTLHYSKIISTVNLVKTIAFDLGWDGEKRPKDRKFLSDLKDILTEWNDIPFKDIQKQIDNYFNELTYYNIDPREAVVFIMCREPKEITRLSKELNAKSVIIRRKEAEVFAASNHADANVLNYSYDIEIDNNGSLLDLAYQALDFVEQEELHIDHWRSIKIDLFGNIEYTGYKE